ncbi:MAG: type II toxin-antitoxin system RelE/ParE family toxin [Candidatus Bathyarchaeia archaeon]
MVVIRNVIWTENFERELKRLKDSAVKERVKRQVEKILENPEAGKPLRFELKGERSLRIPPYRLIYAMQGTTLYLLRLEHRKTVYD